MPTGDHSLIEILTSSDEKSDADESIIEGATIAVVPPSSSSIRSSSPPGFRSSITTSRTATTGSMRAPNFSSYAPFSTATIATSTSISSSSGFAWPQADVASRRSIPLTEVLSSDDDDKDEATPRTLDLTISARHQKKQPIQRAATSYALPPSVIAGPSRSRTLDASGSSASTSGSKRLKLSAAPLVAARSLPSILDDPFLFMLSKPSPPRPSPAADDEFDCVFDDDLDEAFLAVRIPGDLVARSGGGEGRGRSGPDSSDLEDIDSRARLRERERARKGKGREVKGSLSIDDESGTGSSAAAISKTKAKTVKQKEREEVKAAKEAEKAKARMSKADEKAYNAKLKKANLVLKKSTSDLDQLGLIIELSSTICSEPASSSFHPLLADFSAELAERKGSISFFDTPGLNNVMTFRRLVAAKWNEKRRLMVPLEKAEKVREQTVIIYLTAMELVDLIVQDELLDLPSRVRAVVGLGPRAQVMLVVQGILAYYRERKKMEARAYQNEMQARMGGSATASRHPAKGWETKLDKRAIERGLIRLQVSEKVFISNVETNEEAIKALMSIVMDIGIRPQKLIEKSHLNFNPDKTAGSSDIPSQIYSKMLLEVPRVTPAVGQAVAGGFSCMRDLMEGWEKLERGGNSAEAALMLQDLLVSHRKDGAPSNRLINQAISRRIHAILTEDDDLLLVA